MMFSSHMDMIYENSALQDIFVKLLFIEYRHSKKIPLIWESDEWVHFNKQWNSSPISDLLQRGQSLSTMGRGGSRIFRRGCTRLLLYFNTNKPHSFFAEYQLYMENRKSSLGEGGVRTPCTLPLDPPLMGIFLWRPDSIGSKWQEIRILVTATLVLTFFIKSR